MFGKKKKEKEIEAQLQEKSEETKEVSLGTKIKAYTKIAIVVILLLAAVVTVLLLVFRNSSKIPQVYAYVDSKNALYIGEVKNPNEKQLLTDSYYMTMIQEYEPAFKEEIRFSKDGKRIYFPANKTVDSGFDLFVRDYDAPEQEAALLAQEVRHYEVTGDGKVVYQVANGSLYIISEGETVCLADDEDIDKFWLDDKEKNVMWAQWDREKNELQLELHYADLALKEESKKLEGRIEIYEWPYISDDFKRIYFTKDGNLYLIRNLGKKEKISSDAKTDQWYPYNQGEGCYYIVTDEIGENDALYYFNGKKSVLIEENLEWAWPFRTEEGFIGFTVKDDYRHLYLVQGEEVTRIPLDGVREWGPSNILVDEDNQQIYMNICIEEQGITLYQLSYAKGKVGTITAIDDDIYGLEAAKAGKCYYVKKGEYRGYNAYEEDLYCDGELIAENTHKVKPYKNGVYYMTDYDYTLQEGILKKYEKGREKLIGEQVSDYIPIHGKSAFVETDYSVTSFTLAHYNGKKCKVIAEHVRVFDVLE